jgi:hypothetical protein
MLARKLSPCAVHTNTIEGFWSIFKRGVVSTFHKVSEKVHAAVCRRVSVPVQQPRECGHLWRGNRRMLVRFQIIAIVATSVAIIALLLVGEAKSQRRSGRDHPQAQPQQTEQAPAKNQRGTEQNPFVIKIEPAPKSEPEPAKDTNTNDEKMELDRKLVKFNGDLAYYTLVLAVVAALQFLALIVQAIVYAFTLRATSRAADAALYQAKAAVAVENPSPVVHSVKLVGYANQADQVGNLDPVPPGTPPDFFRSLVLLQNTRRTNMRMQETSIDWIIADALPEQPAYRNRVPALGSIFAPGPAVWFWDNRRIITLTAAERQQIQAWPTDAVGVRAFFLS